MSQGAFHWSLGEGVPGNILDVTAEVAPPSGEGTTLLPGTLVADDYRVVSVLGSGTSGVVYRVLQMGTGRDVALKLLSNQCDPVLRERLLREGQVAAALDHPGIGKVFSAGEWRGLPFLVYELLEECQTLEEVFDSLPREEALRIVLEVARAVGYAHTQGVLHRDVKPDNVLLDAAGRARVIDFGHARTEEQPRLTQAGALVGTPLYMAPECFESSDVGPAADVWALGVMLFRALSRGRFPFYGRSMVELAERVWAGDPGSLRISDSGVSPALESVYRRALASKPKARYPNASALADDLDRALRGEPLAARPTSWRGPVFALAASGLLAAAAGALWLLPSSPAEAPIRPETPEAVLSDAQRLLASGELEAARRAVDRYLELRPADATGRELAVDIALRAGDRDGAERLARRLRGGPRSAVLRARIAAAGEEDLPSLLERAQATWPDSPLPTLALLDHRVEQGRLEEARDLAIASAERWPKAVGPRSRVLAQLCGPSPSLERLDLVPPPWRNPVARWLLEEGALDVALLELFSAPETWVRTEPTQALAEAWVMPLGLSPADRRVRARARLDAALALAADPGLRAQTPPILARLVESREREADAFASRSSLMLGKAREDASTILIAASGRQGARELNPKGRPLQEYLDEVLALDPGNWPARYFQARERFYAGDVAQLREALQAVNRCPRLIRDLHFDMRIWCSRQKQLDRPGLGALRASMPREDALDELARLLVGAMALEFEGVTDALGETWTDAQSSLAADPANLLARTLRAFLALRSDRFALARRDLRVVTEALALAPTAEFYGALLLMRQNAPSDEVLAALARARRQEFIAWDGDTRGLHPEHYPEATPYLRLSGMRGYYRLPD